MCYDLRFPVWSRNVAQEYDVLIYVANWPAARAYPWKSLLVARAIENQSYVVAVNRVGHDGNQVYHSGHSMCIDPQGQKYNMAVHQLVVTVSAPKVSTRRVHREPPPVPISMHQCCHQVSERITKFLVQVKYMKASRYQQGTQKVNECK